MERIEHDGIEGIRVGRFPARINTTCIVYRLGSTVIDTGPPNQWAAVRRFLEERDVRRVLVTHHHEDHSGNLEPIRRSIAPTIYAPARGVDRLRDGFPLKPYQRIIWGRPIQARAEAVPERIEIGDGRRLQPFATPGHSDDMTCYFEPRLNSSIYSPYSSSPSS